MGSGVQMDWLEEKTSVVSHKIRNMSFRSAIAAYILVFAAAGAVLSYLTITACYRYESMIWSRYSGDSELWFFTIKLSEWPFWTDSYTGFQNHDGLWMLLLDTIRVWSPFVYGVAGSIAASLLFYKKRLKKPLNILKEGTEQVRRNNLDFDLTYESRDEMGLLCRSFDEMRLELIHNKEMMWELVENQKQLNAAFAHDLRTPLTVLKGYSDFLERYLPQGKISQEKMLETLRLMSEHLSRLEQYSRTMKGIRSLDEIPVQKELYTPGQIQSEILEVIFALNQIGDVEIILSGQTETLPSKKAAVDVNLLLEVLENLLSNAIRFASRRITVTLQYEEREEMLYLVVQDDGSGFTEYDFQKALLPYHREHRKLPEENDGENPHFGIGLHICRQLCAKHGGELSLANSIEGGAVVTASFSSKNE